MRSLWLLPDKDQTGTTLTIENGKIIPLHKSISIRDIPPPITLGIPEEVLWSQTNEDFIYSQFGRTRDNENILLYSSRAGKDISGRTVTITNIQIFRANEDFYFPPKIDEEAAPDIKSLMQTLATTLKNETNASTTKTKAMLEAAKTHKQLKTFSSEPLSHAAFPPDWTPIKKKDKKNILNIAILLLSAITLIYLYLQIGGFNQK